METNSKLTYIPLGGAGDVTKNMHLYILGNEILIIDCGLGFADETMLGVDILLPDISFLKSELAAGKKIVGMAISHGHEDHMGALPFILPDLPSFPVVASPLTAEFANDKLKEFGLSQRVKKIDFDGGEVKLGSFSLNFIRVTHSIPDTAHIFIKTPAGNFYHGSDFKFEMMPFDGKKSDLGKISNLCKQGVTCMTSDCLRSEQKGRTPSEEGILKAFERELAKTQGKFIVTTYSSNIARLNQIVTAAKTFGRKICFVGRSTIKTKEMAQSLGYLKIDGGMEVTLEQLHNFKDSNVVLVAAGSQGQENSALTRIVNGEHKDIKLKPGDTVVFSADAIPGNEISVNSLIDTIFKQGGRVLYSGISSDFHVSGHAASDDLAMLMHLVNPKKIIPIGGTYKQMVQYKNIAMQQGFSDKDVLLAENGQPVNFLGQNASFGKKIHLKNVYVDAISGEEVETFVLRDRQKLATDGVVIVMAEINQETGQLFNRPNIIVRGFPVLEAQELTQELPKQLKALTARRKMPVTDWVYMRKFVGEAAEKYIFKNLRKRPLILPVVIEV